MLAFQFELVNISLFAVRYWYLVVILGMMIDAAIVVFLARHPERRTLLSIYSHLWLLAVILLLFYVSLALGLPIWKLTNA